MLTAEAAARTAAVAPTTPQAADERTEAADERTDAAAEHITVAPDAVTMEDAVSVSMAALIMAMVLDITVPATLLRIRATRQDTTTNTETGKSIRVVTPTRTNLSEGCPHSIEALGHSGGRSLFAFHLE
jgi:hypothetical protein